MDEIKPMPSPFDIPKTEEIASVTKIEKVEKAAAKLGFVKRPVDEPENVRQFKISLLTYTILVLGDLLILLGAAVDFETGLWAFTPRLIQAFLMAVIKDTSVGLIGKILKYYNRKD